MNIQVADIWIAAGVMMGFQVTSFAWRISREVSVGETRDLTWLPPADMVNLASMATIVIGVYLLPILNLVDTIFLKSSFGLAALLFVGYPFALAGHYDMYNRKTERTYKYFPRQERIVIGIIAFVSIIYIVFSLL